MGRLSKENQLQYAYIAGFLDGDGSIMLQLHRTAKGKEIFRIKTVICLYQDSKYLQELLWMQKVLGCGYVYTRNDHISELRIEGFQRVFETLEKLQPYIRFKQKQAQLLVDVIPRIQKKLLVKEEIRPWIQKMRELNYFSSQRNSLE